MMRDDKLIELLEFYSTRVQPRKLSDVAYGNKGPVQGELDQLVACRHAAWMANETILFVNEARDLEAPPLEWVAGTLDARMEIRRKAARSKREKAHRWLGFIQSTLWLCGLYSLDELKEHSRKCSDDPEKEDGATKKED